MLNFVAKRNCTEEKSPNTGKTTCEKKHMWNDLSSDLLRLIIDRLNYEERIHFRAV